MKTLRQFDALEAVRLEQASQGRFDVAELTRLLEGLPQQQPGLVEWVVRGVQTPRGRQQLDLHITAPVQLVCQRCLQPVQEHLESQVYLDLVATEEELEAAPDDDTDPDDVPVDRVLCRGRLDLFAQIEDELILSLPYIARHDVCPEPLPYSAGEPIDAEQPHPFAALAELRHTTQAPRDDSGAGKPKDGTRHRGGGKGSGSTS